MSGVHDTSAPVTVRTDGDEVVIMQDHRDGSAPGVIRITQDRVAMLIELLRIAGGAR